MRPSKFIQSVIVSGVMAFGAGISTNAYAQDGEAQPINLKAEIMTAFNNGAVNDKVVKFSDLQQTFIRVASERLGFFERQYAQGQINALEKTPGSGYVHADETGKPALYISVEYIKAQLLGAVDKPEAKGHEDAVKRIIETTAAAIAQTPNQPNKIAMMERKL